MNAWPAGRKRLWAVLATLIAIAQGPIFLQSIRTTWENGNDFFQDWTSARNILEGRSAYLPLSEAISFYHPHVEGKRPPAAHYRWNAHPPSSVLATLPLALLDYPEAGTLWNRLGLIAMAVSLGLIIHELKFRVHVWSIFPIAAMGLLCSPIRAQVALGQWNAPLLLLLTLAWIAERRGRNLWAGAFVGVAVALKLFPIFFLLYFTIRRRWSAAAAVCFWTIVLTLLTITALGLDTYRDYFNHVLPSLEQFGSGWPNASLGAFWAKNFAKGASYYGLYIEPVIKAPLLAYTGMVLSYASVLVITSFFVNRSRWVCKNKLSYRDLCYALTMVTMLLLTPICWDHYLLLLALPLALIWARLSHSNLHRLALVVLVTAIWLGPNELWRLGGVDVLARWPDFHGKPPRTYAIHRPLFVLVFLSIHFYALLASYVWLLLLAKREFDAEKS
jgi:hypothetical protein